MGLVNTWIHFRILVESVLFIFLVFCVVFLCFVCLCPVSCVPGDASVSGFSIFDYPSVFSNIYLDSLCLFICLHANIYDDLGWRHARCTIRWATAQRFCRVRVARSFVSRVALCRPLFVLFLLTIVFSILLWFTDSDYLYRIFKLF